MIYLTEQNLINKQSLYGNKNNIQAVVSIKDNDKYTDDDIIFLAVSYKTYPNNIIFKLSIFDKSNGLCFSSDRIINILDHNVINQYKIEKYENIKSKLKFISSELAIKNKRGAGNLIVLNNHTLPNVTGLDDNFGVYINESIPNDHIYIGYEGDKFDRSIIWLDDGQFAYIEPRIKLNWAHLKL